MPGQKKTFVIEKKMQEECLTPKEAQRILMYFNRSYLAYDKEDLLILKKLSFFCKYHGLDH